MSSFSNLFADIMWLKSIDYCIEKWPLEHGRALYSIISMTVQYVCPVIILSVAYIRILRKLRYRLIQKKFNSRSKQKHEKKKNRKTKVLLISIALIFGISWLPLNIVNIVADLYFPFNNFQNYRVLFACCHLAGMSSACFNPLLYGFFNDNFRKEFKEIFTKCSPSLFKTHSQSIERIESICLKSCAKEVSTVK